MRQVWALFALRRLAHSQGLDQAPVDMSGTSHGAGVGAGGSQLEVAGIRAMREGETGGFPLIIYSLSLGNQSTAKLSLLTPGLLEATAV